MENGPVSFTASELRDYTKGFEGKLLLGRGGFGRVHRGTIKGRPERNINNEVAVKHSRNKDETTRIQWETELKYLPHLTHPNIIKLIGYCEDRERYYLVYPLMKNGSVKSKLSKLDWKNTLNIIEGTARAIQKLHTHSPPLIYRDLKPQNILLDKDFTPILIDFGGLKPEGETWQHGTRGYTDPEVLNGGIGTKPNDIYSLGVVILQLIMKEDRVDFTVGGHISDWAWQAQSTTEGGHAVNIRLRCPTKVAKAITELGLECVDPNIRRRPTIGQVLDRLAEIK